MNGYKLTRNWFDYKFENPSKVRAIHTDFYIYLVDQWNRLGKKEEFGLPTSYTMECLGIGSYNTYKKILSDLVNFGFVKIIKDSKNQHTSKIIALSKYDEASDKPSDKPSDKALDEATIKANDKPTDTIIKQYKQLNNKQIKTILDYYDSLPSDLLEDKLKELKHSEISKDDSDKILNEEERKKVAPKKERSEEQLKMPEDFIEIWEEWKEYRKAKRFKSYAGLKWEQMAVDKLLELSNNNPTTAKLILKQTYENSYQGFFPLKQNTNGITNTSNTGFSTSKPSTNNGNSGKRSYRQILAARLTNELKANGEGSNITIDAEICE